MTRNRQRAEFQPDELSVVLAHYELGAIQQIEPQAKGSHRSPKVLIASDRGRFLLKRRATGRDDAAKIAFAHRVQRHLAARHFPLAPLIGVRGSQDTLVMREGQFYELFKFVRGQLYDRGLESTTDAGRVLGRFHRLLRNFKSHWEPSRRGYHDSQCVRHNLSGVPAAVGKDDSASSREADLLGTVSALYEMYEGASDHANEAGFRSWPEQIVHADWHPGNMLFSQGRVAAVIDYDSLRLLPPVTDVANGALQFSIIGGPPDPRAWPAEVDVERLRGFFHGYDQEAALTPEQVRALPWLMIEALIAEAVLPIAATGSFGRIEGFRFLEMICRKVRWIEQNGDRLVAVVQA
jgi:Ser/Thr protein kinase RdoA (MazF antagonist)